MKNITLAMDDTLPDEARIVADKRRAAPDLIDMRSVGISGRSRQEFIMVVAGKNPIAPSVDDALDRIESFGDFPIAPIDASPARRGAELSARCRISRWDGAAMAAAQALQANTVYTEDLNPNPVCDDVRVVNPFRAH